MSETQPTEPTPIPDPALVPPAKADYTILELLAEIEKRTGATRKAILNLVRTDPKARHFAVRGSEALWRPAAVDYIANKLKPVEHAQAPVADGVTTTGGKGK